MTERTKAAGTEVPTLPFARDDILDIAARYRELLTSRPITRVRTLVGDEAWLVTGYEVVKELLADDRLGRSHPEPDKAPRVSNFFLNGGPIGDIETEKAEHARMRRLLSPAFSPRRLRALEGRVQHLVDTLLNDMANREPPVDLNEVFSSPLPAYVICELLGVPPGDRATFAAWAADLDNVYDAQRSAGAFLSLSEYVKGLVDLKRTAPAEDVICDLIAAERECNLAPDDIVYLAVGLLFSGYAAPTGTINFGTVLLLLNPDQKDLLLRDASLVADAVEELVRFVPTGARFGQLRYAHTDVQVGAVTIAAGDAVLLQAVVANRDPSVFADPDRLDLTREHNPHLAFGHGAHYCLGAALARMQLQIVFSTLFQRFPTLRLAETVENLELSTQQIAERLVRVPVAW